MRQNNCILLAFIAFALLWLYLSKLENEAQRKLRLMSDRYFEEELNKEDGVLSSLLHHSHHAGLEEELQYEIALMKSEKRKMQDQNLVAINHYIRQLHVNIPNGTSSELKTFISRSNWDQLAYQITYRELYSIDNKYMGHTIAALQQARIVKAEPAPRGTQLKLQLTLENGVLAFFKPKWFDRDFTILGELFAGEDRHNGEIAAFHLDRLLDFRRAPIAVGRILNLTEILAVSTPALSETFRLRPSAKRYDRNDTCLYGKCYYCRPEALVCANEQMLEGAMILIARPLVPTNKKPNKAEPGTEFALQRRVHPYRRSYTEPRKVEPWEIDRSFCRKLNLTRTRMLDLVDTCIFDFLTGNADRHHFETIGDTPSSVIAHVDNGKSFASPLLDELSVLAPLTQCCVVRSATRSRLTALRSGVLSAVLGQILDTDPLSPLLSSAHLDALDRRLERVIRAIDKCARKNKIQNVVLMDD